MVHWYAVLLWVLPVSFVVPFTLYRMSKRQGRALLANEDKSSPTPPAAEEKNMTSQKKNRTSMNYEELGEPILCADTDLCGLSNVGESLLDNGIYPNCLSDCVDDILIFSFPQAITADDLAPLFQQFLSLRHFRAFYWHNLSGTWQICRSPFETKKLVLSFQLSDRHTSISEATLSHIRQQCQLFCSSHQANLSIDPVDVVLKRMNQLNHLIAQVDATVALNIIPRKVNFPGTKLRSLAEASACYYDHEQGFFHRISSEGTEQFRLTALDGSPFDLEVMRRLSFGGVSLSFYLPHVVSPFDSFNQMVSVARRFSQSLDGQMVDDDYRPLLDPHLETIRRMIGQWVTDMERLNLNPGGSISLRVFSEESLVEA